MPDGGAPIKPVKPNWNTGLFPKAPAARQLSAEEQARRSLKQFLDDKALRDATNLANRGMRGYRP
jgi:hypothetical protein